MTTLETILTSILGIAGTAVGGKFLWEYLTSKNSNSTKIQLLRIKKDEDDIKSLELKYEMLVTKYKIIEMQNNQMVTSFRILLPLLEKLAEGDQGLTEAIKVVKSFTQKEPT